MIRVALVTHSNPFRLALCQGILEADGALVALPTEGVAAEAFWHGDEGPEVLPDALGRVCSRGSAPSRCMASCMIVRFPACGCPRSGSRCHWDREILEPFYREVDAASDAACGGLTPRQWVRDESHRPYMARAL